MTKHLVEIPMRIRFLVDDNVDFDDIFMAARSWLEQELAWLQTQPSITWPRTATGAAGQGVDLALKNTRAETKLPPSEIEFIFDLKNNYNS